MLEILQSEARRCLQRAAGEAEKRYGKKKYPCLVPSCKKMAVRCHSQQRRGQLVAIARDSLVYTSKRNLWAALKRANEINPVEYSLVGISEASTFKGFCSTHDKELFDGIERRELAPHDLEQSRLLFLRSFAYEYAAKRRAIFDLEVLLDRCATKISDEARSRLSGRLSGARLFISREGPFYLNKLLGSTSSGDLGELISHWRVIPHNLGISVSCCINPALGLFDTRGNADQLNGPQPLVSFSIIPSPSQTSVVMSWFSESQEWASWIESYLEAPDRYERLLNRFAFYENEDLCINPDLWDSLPEDKKAKCNWGMRDSLARFGNDDFPVILSI